MAGIYREGMLLYIAALDTMCPMVQLKNYLTFCEIDSTFEEYIFRTISKDRKPSLRRKNVQICQKKYQMCQSVVECNFCLIFINTASGLSDFVLHRGFFSCVFQIFCVSVFESTYGRQLLEQYSNFRS